MKILHRKVLSELLLNLGMALLVFTFVLLMGNGFRDIMMLLSTRNVGLGSALQFFILLVPYVLSFSMPMALMAATLLVIGRISADSELTGARACGVSFFELSLPILGLAGVMSMITLYINCTLAPQMKHAFNRTFVDMAFDQPMSLLEEGQPMKDFENMVIYIGRKDPARRMIYDVRVHKFQNNEMTEQIYAERGEVSSDRKLKKIWIQLINGRRDERTPGRSTDMSKRRWDESFRTFPLDLDMTRLVDQRRAVKETNHKTSSELWQELQEWKAQGNHSHPTPKLVELHKRVALSMACLAFVLVALPLGVQVHRRESSIGILISLVLSVGYYLLVLLAESFKKYPDSYPEFIIWLPNLLFQTVGLYLLWRQNRV